MYRILKSRLSLLGLVCAFAALPVAARADAADKAIASLTKDVGGTKLHYLSAGRGPTVILLHGYAETSRMWRPLDPGRTAKGDDGRAGEVSLSRTRGGSWRLVFREERNFVKVVDGTFGIPSAHRTPDVDAG